MAVTVKDVEPGSPCAGAGVTGGCRLLTINGHEIDDVLDYRFHGSARRQHLVFETPDGDRLDVRMKTDGTPDPMATMLLSKYYINHELLPIYR